MKVFERQGWMVLYLTVSLYLLYYLTQQSADLLTGELWGLSTQAWLVTAVVLAIGHHFLVWFCWRFQLYYSLITRYLGMSGFYIYSGLFFVFFIPRICVVFFLGYANRNSLEVSHLFLYTVTAVITPFILYTFYSVRKYFGLLRATGIDHFDPAYRKKPLVRQGMFKYTNNAMYTFGLLLLLVPGLIFASKTALLIGVFNYCYGWVHYFTLEVPDMREIYLRG